MFPIQSISTSTVISGNTTYPLVSTTSPIYILGVRMQQSGTASETVVRCNNGVVGFNYGKDYPLDLQNFLCEGGVTITKTGNDSSFVSLTYLPYWATSTKTEVNFDHASILNGYTYGELWIGLLLLFIFLIQFFGGILNQVFGLKGRARNTRNPNIK